MTDPWFRGYFDGCEMLSVASLEPSYLAGYWVAYCWIQLAPTSKKYISERAQARVMAPKTARLLGFTADLQRLRSAA